MGRKTYLVAVAVEHDALSVRLSVCILGARAATQGEKFVRVGGTWFAV